MSRRRTTRRGTEGILVEVDFKGIFKKHGLNSEERELVNLCVSYFSLGILEYFRAEVPEDGLETLDHWLVIQDMVTQMSPKITAALVEIYKPLNEITSKWEDRIRKGR